MTFLVALYLGNYSHANGKQIDKKITETEARSLIELALDHSHHGYAHNSLGYDGDDSKISPPFFSYELFGDVDILGFYAVNPWTGDVWQLMPCHHYSGRALNIDIQKIRQRFNTEELASYKQLQSLHPNCMD